MTQFKTVLLSLGISILAFFAPLYTSFACVLVLTLLDAAFAILVAIKNKQTVESKKLRNTISKLAIYFVAISAAFLAETSILGVEHTLGFISKAIIAIVSFTELKSLLENLSGYMQADERINFWQVILANIQAKAGQLNVPTPAEKPEKKDDTKQG